MKTNIAPEKFETAQVIRLSLLHKLARKAVIKQLGAIKHGQITLHDGEQRWTFGTVTDTCPLLVDVRILHPDCYLDTAFGGDTGVGESYMKGHWSCSNLTHLVRIFVVNRDALTALDFGYFAKMTMPLKNLLHRMNKNSKKGSGRNIQAHYDIGNELFELFLDNNMMYSSAIYPHTGATLEEASEYKLDVICRKLDLQASDHLLEIGAGWGGLAIHAASRYGCRVTTTTISKEQFQLASERIKNAGLGDRITVLLQDYRDLQGEYDKLVSVEMIEAVGHQYFGVYFNKCSQLLKQNGLMLLQTITIADQLYESTRRTVDFIRRYIFPGGCLPSVHIIMRHIADNTDMQLRHMDEFGEHYARTLAEWRERFFRQIEQVKALGYPESFVNMWEYYLCYCEGGFLEKSIGVTQMLFGKPQNRCGMI
jgi:cyclopropane-fatty-acyl-phospholipid synthase